MNAIPRMSTILTGAPPIGRDQARELARRELRKQVYHRDDPSFLDRIWRRISEWFDRLQGHAPGEHTGGGGSWGALVVVVLLLALIAAAIWWRVGSVRGSSAQREALLDDEPSTARDHRDEAERYAAAGEWPQAIRERLRAIARDLEERAILDPRPGRTADEMGGEAGAALPSLADELTAGVRLFDDVWYGGRTGDPDGYQRLVALDKKVRSTRPVPLAERVAPDSLTAPR